MCRVSTCRRSVGVPSRAPLWCCSYNPRLQDHFRGPERVVTAAQVAPRAERFRATPSPLRPSSGQLSWLCCREVTAATAVAFSGRPTCCTVTAWRKRFGETYRCRCRTRNTKGMWRRKELPGAPNKPRTDDNRAGGPANTRDKTRPGRHWQNSKRPEAAPPTAATLMG